MKSGMVGILGRPNVGKSTFLNEILKKKVAITSDKSGTTRNIILGVYNDQDSQIAFVDTPGIRKPSTKLDNILNNKSYMMIDNPDLILFMVDISKGYGKGDKFILDNIKEENKKIILLLNKIDKLNKEELIKRIDEISKEYNFLEIIPLSAIKKINIKEIIKTIKKYLPDGERWYDIEYLTNQSKEMIITERVREKVLWLTNKEVPYTVTCVLDEFEEDDKLLKARVNIIIDRDNLKKIIIGKGGNMLKEIGTKARIDLEEYFNKKVYLELHVKTVKNWRDSDSLIKDLGLKDDLDE